MPKKRSTAVPARRRTGEITLALNTIILLALGAVVTVLIVGIIIKPLTIFGKTADKGTRGTFNDMKAVLREFGVAGANAPTSRTLPLFVVKDDYIIVAFNAAESSVYDKCAKKSIDRPASCDATTTCLCLCTETGCATSSQCASFPNIKTITSKNLPKDNFLADNALLVYGDCGVLYTSLRPQPVYVHPEKDDAQKVVLDGALPS